MRGVSIHKYGKGPSETRDHSLCQIQNQRDYELRSGLLFSLSEPLVSIDPSTHFSSRSLTKSLSDLSFYYSQNVLTQPLLTLWDLSIRHLVTP